MTPRLKKCDLCAEQIEKGKEKYYNGNLVCANCWYREKRILKKEQRGIVRPLRYLVQNSTIL